MSYIAIILGVLLLLNTYPLIVSEDLVFSSKETAMENSASVLVYALSGLDRLTEENVASAMSLAEDTALNRILVTDASGLVLYDTREIGSALGKYAFYSEIVQALRGNDAFSCAFRDGAFRSYAASPVLYQNRIIGAVYAYEYDTEQASLLSGLQRNLLRVSIAVALAVLLLSVLLSRALTRKISALLAAIRRVRGGEYDCRVPVSGHDEIAQIGEAFNRMTDRLQQTETVRRRFVSDASHELKTPLAAIRLLTDSILQTDSIDRETAREFVADIGKEAERLTRVTEDLLRLTRLDSGVQAEKTEQVDVSAEAEQVTRMMLPLAEQKGVEITLSAEPNCLVTAAGGEIRQVLYNLIDNAVKYAQDAGAVRVEVSREKDEVVLTVSDNGAGIPEEDLPRIFERFYRVDKARSRAAGGTGLGLSIVRDTVEKWNGSVRADNAPEGGAVFTVRLPAGNGGAAE